MSGPNLGRHQTFWQYDLPLIQAVAFRFPVIVAASVPENALERGRQMVVTKGKEK
jgi:hypothetical protein